MQEILQVENRAKNSHHFLSKLNEETRVVDLLFYSIRSPFFFTSIQGSVRM